MNTNRLKSETKLRQTAEKNLQIQQSVLSSIIESTNDLIFSVDTNYCYTNFNSKHAEVMKNIYGTVIQVGKSLLDCMTIEDDRAKAKINIDKTLTGEILIEESFSGDKLLSRLYFEIKHYPVFDNNGKCIGVTIISADITEKKRKEEELKKSENQNITILEKLKEAQNIASVGSWEWNLETNDVWWSEEVFRIFEVSPEEFEPDYNSVSFFIHPNDFEMYKQTFQHSLQTAKELDLDIKLLTKLKNVKHCNLKGRVSLNKSKQPVLFSGTILDITFQKTAEQALKESEERWKFAIDGSGDGLWDWKSQTNEVFFSTQWKKMLGFEENEIGNSLDEWSKRLHPDDKEHVYADLNNHLEGKTPFYVNEHRILCKDGSYKWILDRGKVMQWNKDGKPLRVIGTHTDISEKVKAEEQIKGLSEIVENSLNEIYIFDAESLKFMYANKVAIKNCGYTIDEFLELTPLDIKPEINHDYFQSIISPLLNQNKKIINFETVHQRKNGTKYPVDVHVQLTHFGGKKAFVAFISDNTERKNAETQIQRNEKLLRLFIQHSPASIAMFDKNMIYIIASERFKMDYDLGNQNLPGRSHYDVFPEITERWKEIHKRCLAGETMREAEDPFPRADGKLDWVRWEIRPWYETENEIGGIILFSEVITEQKITREKVFESDEYNRMLFNQSPIGLAVAKMDGTLVDINQSFANIIGYTIEEIKMLTYWDITPKKYEDQEKIQLDSLTKTGKYGPYQKEYIHKDGHLVNVQLKGLIIVRKGEKFIWSSVEDISKRLEAEKALELSEEKFRKAFQTSTDSISITSMTDDRYIEINNGFEKITGYSRKEVIGKSALNLNIIKNNDDRNKLINSLLEYGFIENLETEFITKNGKIIYGLLSAIIIEINNEKAILSITRDITDRKKAEEKIREATANLESMLDNRNDSIWSLDREYKYIVFNKTYAEIFFKEQGIVLEKGMNALDLLAAELHDFWKSKFEPAFRGENVDFEFSYIIDGKEHSFQVFLNPIYNNGIITGASALSMDITERKEAELLIKESEERYRSIYENSSVAILLTSPDGSILSANDFACQIFGRTETEICNAGREGLVDKSDPNLQKLLEHRRIHGQSKGELTFLKKDGTGFPCEVSSVIFVDKEGKERTSMVIRDLTEQKKSEKEITKLTEDLELKVKERTYELETKMQELNRLNKLFVDRELRMVELKEKIKNLEEKIKDNFN